MISVDGLIQVLKSRAHYSFNVIWLFVFLASYYIVSGSIHVLLELWNSDPERLTGLALDWRGSFQKETAEKGKYTGNLR